MVTTIGSDVTLKWSCRVRGNHSVGMLAWSLKLHTVTDRTRIALLYYSPKRFWIDVTKSIHYGRRVRWTGEASQGKISFVIQDVRISDAQSYKLSWKVILPSRNGSRQVVMTQSKLMVTVAGNYWYNIKARSKGGCPSNHSFFIMSRDGRKFKGIRLLRHKQVANGGV